MKKRVIKLGIANEGEILEFLTYIMRREDEEIRMADSFKAAELLGSITECSEARAKAEAVML